MAGWTEQARQLLEDVALGRARFRNVRKRIEREAAALLSRDSAPETPKVASPVSWMGHGTAVEIMGPVEGRVWRLALCDGIYRHHAGHQQTPSAPRVDPRVVAERVAEASCLAIVDAYDEVSHERARFYVAAHACELGRRYVFVPTEHTLWIPWSEGDAPEAPYARVTDAN